MQQTLKNSVKISGIGLHTGGKASLALRPAEAGSGIKFISGGGVIIPALWNHVVDTRMCTVIGNESGARVATIEHLMAALRGCGIDNALIEIDGPEVPAMDGSAMPFVEMIEDAGISPQCATRRAIRVLKEVSVEDGDKRVALSPSDAPVFSGEIEFSHAKIGAQKFETRLLNGDFRHDIADARTFGFLSEVEWMRKNGLGLGGSLENAIILDQSGVMNPGGLRHEDEFIRHKILDAIGDLYLAGGRIIGAYHGVRAGHALNNAVLRKLFSSPGAWEMVEERAEEAVYA